MSAASPPRAAPSRFSRPVAAAAGTCEEAAVDELYERIVDAAMELAERDGYDAVRLRDLAASADVALGTVYRRFASKEDILAAVLDRESSRLEAAIEGGTLPGDTPRARLLHFFSLATAALVARPKLARATLRTVASGEPELSQKVLRFHGRITRIILLALHGPESTGAPASPAEHTVAHFLQQIWFGALIGWSGGLHSAEEIDRQMENACRLLLAGLGQVGEQIESGPSIPPSHAGAGGHVGAGGAEGTGRHVSG